MSGTLEWHESHLLGGAVTYNAFTKRGRYTILALTNGKFHTQRMEHPLMPTFDGYCFSLNEAKRVCEHDAIRLARADRWLDFMADNEPPTFEESL